MSEMMKYRGYLGSVSYSPEDRVFHGKLEYIRSLVTFEGSDADSLEQAFRDSADDYLESCEELGLRPETPFRGTFNVRTGTELHRRASLYAASHDKSLNQVITDAIETYLSAQGA